MRIISKQVFCTWLTVAVGLYIWPLVYYCMDYSDLSPGSEFKTMIAYIIMGGFSMVGFILLLISMLNTEKHGVSDNHNDSCNTWKEIITQNFTGRGSIALGILAYAPKHIMGWYFMINYLPTQNLDAKSVIGIVTLIEFILTLLLLEPIILVSLKFPRDININPQHVYDCRLACHTSDSCIAAPLKILMYFITLIPLGLNILYIYALWTLPRSEYTKSYVHFTIIQEIFWAILLGFCISTFNRTSPRMFVFGWWGSVGAVYAFFLVFVNIANMLMGSSIGSAFKGIFSGAPFNCSGAYQGEKMWCAIVHINVGLLLVGFVLTILGFIALSILFGIYKLIACVCCYNPRTGNIEDDEWCDKCCSCCFSDRDQNADIEQTIVSQSTSSENEHTRALPIEIKIDIPEKSLLLTHPDAPKLSERSSFSVETCPDTRKYSAPDCVICSSPFEISNPFPIARPCAHQVICTKCVVENHKKYSTCSICRAPIDSFIFN